MKHRHKLPKFTPKEMIWTVLLSTGETEFIAKKTPTKKMPDLGKSSGKFYQTFKW